jgi:hypothetical protein
MNLLLEREQNTLREIKKIFICFCFFTDGKNNKMFKAELFKYQMKKYKELVITLNFIIEELKKNGENVEVYKNIDNNFNEFYVEFQKIYDEQIKISS